MPQPNILWLCTDQQRYDTVGALNNPHVRTPNINQLVREGVAFTHAFCQSPICTPSRASFLTGMYPSTIHACTNGNETWADAAPLVTKTLADAGYDGGLVGKFHMTGSMDRTEPRLSNDGYRYFEFSHAPRDSWAEGHDYADWVKEQGHNLSDLRENPEQIPPELHQTSWCAEKSIEFIEQDHGEKPWFLSFNPYYPHPPFDPPQVYRDRYDKDSLPRPLFRDSDLIAQEKLTDVDFQSKAQRPEDFDAQEIVAKYYAMIELIDDNIGRILASLERTGQRDNTLIIFMSDHGETLGDHGLLFKGCRFYEGLVRVPLIFSWRNHFQPGLVSDALVELSDITPTLLEICGLPQPERMQGKSLLKLLNGEAVTHRDFVRSEYYHTLRPGKENDFSGSYGTMLRTERYKLVVYHGHNFGELFDLEDDPGEFINRWDDPDYQQVRFDLLLQSCDQLAFAVDIGPKQIMYS
ncbi:MAG: sulfatase-like hydrolase/transferase [Chloroflexota bacterium]